MRSLLRHIFLSTSILFISSDLNAQAFNILMGQDTTRRVIPTAIPFLTIAPDAWAGGMGEVGAATPPDAASGHWNPAKFAFIKDEFGVSYSRAPWLRKIFYDVHLSFASLYKRLSRKSSMAASIRYFHMGDVNFNSITLPSQFSSREFSFDLTYARMVAKSMSVLRQPAAR